MDVSKEYIKMCDCPEIQEQWKVEIGEDYWDDEEHQIVWYEGMESREQIRGRIDVYKSDLQPKWLPRQDQIQEMLQPIELHELLEVCGEPNGIIQTALHEYADSMEQLWLAFYLFENHQKIWDSKKEKWIKSE